MTHSPAHAEIRGSDVVGMMSTTAGVIGMALVIWGQLYGRARDAFHASNGHPVDFDALSQFAKLPGLLCAALGLVLAIVVLRRRGGGRAWAVAGVLAAAVAVFFTAGGVPIGLMR